MKTPPQSTSARRVADELVRRIFSEQYPAGLRLPPEVELAEEFGCGRSTIREALRHLAALNLIESRRGSGAVVLDFRREGGLQLLPAYFLHGTLEAPLPVLVEEMLRVRTSLACEAVRLAASYGKPEDIRAIAEAIDKAHSLRQDPEKHALAELEVFRQMAMASRLWPAVWLANDFLRPMRHLMSLVAGPIGSVPTDWKATMDEVLHLIETHQADRAVDIMRRHFEKVDTQVSQLLGALLPANPPGDQ